MYSYITAFEVGLCVHKKLHCLIIHIIYRYFNVRTMAASAIIPFLFSVNNDGGIFLHSWSPINMIKLVMLMASPLSIFVLFAEQ